MEPLGSEAVLAIEMGVPVTTRAPLVGEVIVA